MEYTFKIPFLPPSTNSIYSIIYAHKQVKMTEEARMFKTIAKGYMPPMSFKEEARFKIEIEVHKDWYLKSDRKKLKRQDLSNLEKLLFDSIFEHIGMDDKNLCYYSLSKKQEENGKEFLIVNIKSIDNPGENGIL